MTPSRASKIRYRFTDAVDACLLQQVLHFQPYHSSHGTRAACWELVRDGMVRVLDPSSSSRDSSNHSLNPTSDTTPGQVISDTTSGLKMPSEPPARPGAPPPHATKMITARACRDRFKILMSRRPRQGYSNPDQERTRSLVKQIKRKMNPITVSRNGHPSDGQERQILRGNHGPSIMRKSGKRKQSHANHYQTQMTAAVIADHQEQFRHHPVRTDDHNLQKMLSSIVVTGSTSRAPMSTPLPSGMMDNTASNSVEECVSRSPSTDSQDDDDLKSSTTQARQTDGEVLQLVFGQVHRVHSLLRQLLELEKNKRAKGNSIRSC